MDICTQVHYPRTRSRPFCERKHCLDALRGTRDRCYDEQQRLRQSLNWEKYETMESLDNLAHTCDEHDKRDRLDKRELLRKKEKFEARTDGALAQPPCHCEEHLIDWLNDEICVLEKALRKLEKIKDLIWTVKARRDRDMRASDKHAREIDTGLRSV